MKKATRPMTLVLAALMALAMLALSACANNTGNAATSAPPAEESTAPAASEAPANTEGTPDTKLTYQLDTSPVDITCYFRARWWDGTIDEGDGWEDSAIFKHIQEKTGVSFHYEVPAASEQESIGPMIAAGTYPDMISFGSYTNPYIAQMKDADLLYSLTDLSQQYAPALFEQDMITKTMRAFFEDENDKLWFYVGFEGNDASVQAYMDINYAPTSGENILYVRKDMLKAWGKNDIASWKDFNDLLAFIKANYPDVDPIRLDAGDQVNGLIGRHFLSCFGCHLSGTYVDTDNQKLLYLLKDPNAVNYLKWLNSLYIAGIINDTMLSDSADIRSEKVYAGNYGVILSSTFNASNSINTVIEENDGNADRTYVALSQVSYNDQDLFQAETIKGKGGSATVITKNCKIPDRAIRLIEYFLTEDGQVTGTLGVEGVTWEWKDDKRVLMEEPAALISSNLTEYVGKYKTLGAFTNFASQVYWAQYCDDFLTPTGALRDMNNGLLGPYLTEIWNYGFVNIRGSLVSGSEEEIASTKINELQANYTTKMIAAKNQAEFDANLQSLLTDAKAAGLESLEEKYTQEYLDNCEALDITAWKTLSEKKPYIVDFELIR